jgi:hypothetical protein
MQVSFTDFIFRNSTHRWFVWVGVIGVIIQFVAFKMLYPYPGFINGDSYVYLDTAYHNFSINVYPVGYSKFLRLFSVFTHSDTALVLFQYLFLEGSVLAFVFTIFYFYKPDRVTKILLFGFMLFNPVFLYLANYISSDAFFLSISLIWFTLLIWIMNLPTNKLIFINAIILFVAFTVRYNALFYPIISGVALVLSRRKIFANLCGFFLSVLLIGSFMYVTSAKYKEISGHSQFTPFTGWQLANNALYGYRYVDSSHLKKTPVRFQELDRMVRNYFDTTKDIKKHPQEALLASTVYMWDDHSPLIIYKEKQFEHDSSATILTKWATVAPLMNDYGTFLIRTYPKEFTKYYLIPNALKYYAPPIEFLSTYSTGVDSVQLIAKVWFEFKSNKLWTYSKDLKVNVLNFYPVLTGTMNVVLLFSMISFLFLNGYKQHPQLRKGLLLVVALWGVNFGFSVFASPIALRFQLFPILVSLTFTFLLIEFLIKAAKGSTFKEEPAIKGVVIS